MTVPAGNILFSIILLGLVYVLLLILYLFLIVRKIKIGPEEIKEKEAVV
jgi:cytochrome d ubiquinol oxidase subunit I